MEEIKLVLTYPKTYPIGISDEQRESFDINDANKVKEIIGAALAKINDDDELRPHLGEVETDCVIIELLLEDAHANIVDLENNGTTYWELVLEYVKKNFLNQKTRYKRTVNGINSGGGYKKFCVNGHPVGNYRNFARSENDRKQRID